MVKLNVQFKQNNKLVIWHKNVPNAKPLGLKQLDVIMYSVKFANIIIVTSVEEKAVGVIHVKKI